MKTILITLLILIITLPAHALDKKLGATNSFRISIYDTSLRMNAITDLDVNATGGYDDYEIHIKCGNNTEVTMNETGDTIVYEGSGVYYITTNDAITNNPEEECGAWVMGTGVNLVNGSSVIAKVIRPFKAIGATIDAVTVGSINTGAITTASITDGAITPAKEYVALGTVNAASTTLKVYTALGVASARTYNNMCLYSASNGERSRITSTGSGFFNVRGFSVAPADTTVLRIYTDGCL